MCSWIIRASDLFPMKKFTSNQTKANHCDPEAHRPFDKPITWLYTTLRQDTRNMMSPLNFSGSLSEMSCPGHLSPCASPLCTNHFRPHLPDRPSLMVLTYTDNPFPPDPEWATLQISEAFPAVSLPWGPVPYHMSHLCPLQSDKQMLAGWVTLFCLCASLQRKIQLQGGISSITCRGEGHQFFVGTEESHIYRVNFTDFKETLIATCHFEAVQDIVFPL